MEQLSFFDERPLAFWDKLKKILNDLILSLELPNNSLHLFSNISQKGANAGKEISKSLCIYEPEYPAIKEDVDNPGKNFVVMNIKSGKNIELLIRNGQFDVIDFPETAEIKSVKSDTTFVHVLFHESDQNIFSYIEKNILYCLKNYRTKERTFGCCSQFVKCSDAKRCLHSNKLYSTACSYRHHLEAGHIFYGINKNV